MKYCISNGTVLLWNGIDYYLSKEDIFINGSSIEYVGNGKRNDSNGYTVIDASNHLVTPGLINSHTHAYMSFMKNSADNLPFDEWLFNRIIPVENRMIKSDFYSATMLGCIEMLRSGVTTFVDMHICEDECAKAVSDSKMRAFMGKCIRGTDINGDARTDFQKALDDKLTYDSELINTILSPHSVYACSPRLLFQISEYSDEYGMIKHIHLSESDNEIKRCFAEYGKTPVKHLYDLGFLDSRTIAAHCVKVTDDDMNFLKEKDVNVVTNPSSNAKLGNGIAPVTDMSDRGINICLGTDSAASNNTLNMFREMNFFNLIHKAKNKSAISLSTNDILKSVTINPAKALGAEMKLGVIAEGACADLIFIDLNSPSLFPNNNIISSLCCSANGTEVDSVMVNGEFLMKDRKLTTIDEEKIYYKVKRMVEKYFN